MKWNLQFSLYVYIIDVKLIFRSYFIHELSQSWKNASVQKRQQRLQQLEHFQPFRIWKSSWASFPLHSYQQQKLTLLQERAQEKALENLLTVVTIEFRSSLCFHPVSNSSDPVFLRYGGHFAVEDFDYLSIWLTDIV